MVLLGQVGEDDRIGNDLADWTMKLLMTGVIMVLHRFFIAVARTVVTHDGVGGTALDPFSVVRWFPPQETLNHAGRWQPCYATWSRS